MRCLSGVLCGRSFPRTGRRADEGEVGIQTIRIGSATLPGRCVENHYVAGRRVLAGDPTFAPQIFQGGFDIDQAASEALRQAVHAHVEARVAKAERERIHMDRAANQNGEQAFGIVGHAFSLFDGEWIRSACLDNAIIRQEAKAVKMLKHANDADRTMACSHTMGQWYILSEQLATRGMIRTLNFLAINNCAPAHLHTILARWTLYNAP